MLLTTNERIQYELNLYQHRVKVLEKKRSLVDVQMQLSGKFYVRMFSY